jgi:hypothetical protein
MKNKTGAAILNRAAVELEKSLRAMGDYAHVSVRAERGHLVIYVDDDEPVARLTPIGNGRYGLGFHSHAGRWESMPFTGELAEMPATIVQTLGPYLDKGNFV